MKLWGLLNHILMFLAFHLFSFTVCEEVKFNKMFWGVFVSTIYWRCYLTEMHCLLGLVSEAVTRWVCLLRLFLLSSLRSRSVTRGFPSCHWTAASCLSSCSFSTCWLLYSSSTSTSTGRCGGTPTVIRLPLPHSWDYTDISSVNVEQQRWAGKVVFF